jgi:hypothetical protein
MTGDGDDDNDDCVGDDDEEVTSRASISISNGLEPATAAARRQCVRDLA